MSRFLVGASAFAILTATVGPAHAVVSTSGDNAIDPGWPAAGAFVGIGHDNSGPAVGSLTIDGGSVAQARSVQIGSTVDSSGMGTINNGTLNLVHDPGAGFGDANLRVGENGTGYLSVSNGGQINFSNGNALAMIGRRDAAVGTLELDNGHMNMVSDPTNGAYATIQVGRGGATGAFYAFNGSSVMLSDPSGVPGTGPVSGEGINVGRDAGSNGVMVVDSSTVSIQGTGSYFLVGRDGGTGSVEFLNGTTVTMQSTSGHSADGAGFSVGAYGNGADGTLVVVQSTLSMDGGASSSHISIGREADGSGSAFFAGNTAAVSLTSSTVANIFVGRSGSGHMTVSDEATVELTASADNHFIVAQEPGATGTLTVLSGGRMIANTGADGDMLVGAAFADFGRAAAGSGTVLIDGAGSEISVLDDVLIGGVQSLGGGTGSGVVTVRNGGQLTATDVRVGTGGILAGDGIINANVIVDGGVIAPGNSPGTMTIIGDFDLMMGTLIIEVTGLGAGEFDLFEVTGNVDLSGGLVEFVFSNGFAPTIGESFDFFSGASSINTTGTSFSYSGLEAGFLFDVAPDVSGNLRFQALNTGVPSATPEPGVLVLVAGGLLGIGLATRKRSQ